MRTEDRVQVVLTHIAGVDWLVIMYNVWVLLAFLRIALFLLSEQPSAYLEVLVDKVTALSTSASTSPHFCCSCMQVHSLHMPRSLFATLVQIWTAGDRRGGGFNVIHAMNLIKEWDDYHAMNLIKEWQLSWQPIIVIDITGFFGCVIMSLLPVSVLFRLATYTSVIYLLHLLRERVG